MWLKFVLDEHLRGPLWHAVVRHNARRSLPLDVVRVGDEDAPQLGASDPEILRWAEEHERILVTLDEQTMPRHLQEHLAAGQASPGVFLVRPNASISKVIEFLGLVMQFSESMEWTNRVTFIP